MIAKNNLTQTLDRLLAYAERRLGRGIVAAVQIPPPEAASAGDASDDRTALEECVSVSDLEGCVQRAAAAVRSFPRDGLSDHLPWIYPTLNFGESVWSGFFGATIRFSGTRAHTWSYCADPPLKDLVQFPLGALDTTNYWYRKMIEVTTHYVRHLPPQCDLTPFIFMDCMNLLVELRGATAAYTDLYDYPEKMTPFMDWSVDVNNAFYDAQADLMREFTSHAFGGHAFQRYSSARIPNLSIDAYGMCAPEVYRQWGLKQHQRIVRRYGGGRLHIHGNGRHLCELVAQVEGLTTCGMGDDVGYPPAWTIVKELKERMAPVPIEIDIPMPEFAQGLRQRTLLSGVYYRTIARSLAEANAIMERVFDYRSAER
jgi:hypothetical protein